MYILPQEEEKESVYPWPIAEFNSSPLSLALTHNFALPSKYCDTPDIGLPHGCCGSAKMLANGNLCS